MSHLPTRERLPKRRRGTTHSVEVNGASLFMTTNEFTDGRPGEVFAKWGKEGSTAGGLMDAFSIALDHLPADKRALLGIFSIDEQARVLADQHPAPSGLRLTTIN